MADLDTLNTILDACPALPPVPAALARVTALIADEDADARSLGEIVRHDEALAGLVLRRANSVAFGVPGKSFDLPTSITRLGTRELVRLIMRHEATRLLPLGHTVYGLGRVALWRNAVGGAIAAEALAPRASGVDASECYVAALLRDIGKLALETTLGHEAIDAVGEANADGGFVRRERAVLGVDHADLGGALAARWDLPDSIVEAIRFHHEPPLPGEPRYRRLNDVVHAADMICLWSGLGCGDDGTRYGLAEHARVMLGLDREIVEPLAAMTWERVRGLEHELGIED